MVMIDGWVVKQDSQGRYCLNDVHKASGGEHRHRAHFWAESVKTQEVISRLNSGNPEFNSLVSKPGRYGGTYAGGRRKRLLVVDGQAVSRVRIRYVEMV